MEVYLSLYLIFLMKFKILSLQERLSLSCISIWYWSYNQYFQSNKVLVKYNFKL
jgi:hypothetical protein